MKIGWVLSTLAVVALMSGALVAQDTDKTVKMLEETVMRLQARVSELESGAVETESALESQINALNSMGALAADNSLDSLWNDGIRFRSGGDDFDIRVGGRILNDWAFMVEDDDLEHALGHELEDGTEFRRAQLDLSGTVYERIYFEFEIDFAGGDADFGDVFIGVNGLGAIGHIQVGHMREPFGLERQMEITDLTFMERALPAALVPYRSTGIMAWNTAYNQRIWWGIGVFRDTDDAGNSPANMANKVIGEDGKYNFTARVAGRPWCNGATSCLHVGASFTYRNPNDHVAHYASTPESHLAGYFLDTGYIPTDDCWVAGGEIAFTLNSFSLQGEIVYKDLDRGSNPDTCFWGWYVQASFFLTGESRVYDPMLAAFGRVRPKQNALDGAGGSGAWEVAARASYLDLSDGGIDGGELFDVTLALNWYLNPATRISFNYVYADFDGGGSYDGIGHIFQFRIQLRF